MSNFWKDLPSPFLVLAPMEGVTDVVFREIVAKIEPPDVFFTEFTSANGLISPGRDETIKRLRFTKNQRPIVAQIWGIEPEYMFESAKLVSELGFNGVDINMGCPDKAVMKMGCGAAHINNPSLSKEIIHAVKEGAKDIAVSVKTRIGYNSIVEDKWLPFLLEQEIDALTIHGRTASQKSNGQANWEIIGKAVQYRNSISPNTKIIGNGDVESYESAQEMHELYKVDGIMIGRGIFTNPWVFEKDSKPHSEKEYMDLLLKHLHLFEKTWGETKNFEVMKKYFKIYVREFDGASQLRFKLMECKTPREVEEIINQHFAK